LLGSLWPLSGGEDLGQGLHVTNNVTLPLTKLLRGHGDPDKVTLSCRIPFLGFLIGFFLTKGEGGPISCTGYNTVTARLRCDVLEDYVIS
jgi:hypothetical protein